MNFLIHTLTPYLLVALAAPLAFVDFPGACVLCVLALFLRWLDPREVA